MRVITIIIFAAAIFAGCSNPSAPVDDDCVPTGTYTTSRTVSDAAYGKSTTIVEYTTRVGWHRYKTEMDSLTWYRQYDECCQLTKESLYTRGDLKYEVSYERSKQ